MKISKRKLNVCFVLFLVIIVCGLLVVLQQPKKADAYVNNNYNKQQNYEEIIRIVDTNGDEYKRITDRNDTSTTYVSDGFKIILEDYKNAGFANSCYIYIWNSATAPSGTDINKNKIAVWKETYWDMDLIMYRTTYHTEGRLSYNTCTVDSKFNNVFYVVTYTQGEFLGIKGSWQGCHYYRFEKDTSGINYYSTPDMQAYDGSYFYTNRTFSITFYQSYLGLQNYYKEVKNGVTTNYGITYAVKSHTAPIGDPGRYEHTYYALNGATSQFKVYYDPRPCTGNLIIGNSNDSISENTLYAQSSNFKFTYSNSNSYQIARQVAITRNGTDVTGQSSYYSTSSTTDLHTISFKQTGYYKVKVYSICDSTGTTYNIYYNTAPANLSLSGLNYNSNDLNIGAGAVTINYSKNNTYAPAFKNIKIFENSKEIYNVNNPTGNTYNVSGTENALVKYNVEIVDYCNIVTKKEFYIDKTSPSDFYKNQIYSNQKIDKWYNVEVDKKFNYNDSEFNHFAQNGVINVGTYSFATLAAAQRFAFVLEKAQYCIECEPISSEELNSWINRYGNYVAPSNTAQANVDYWKYKNSFTPSQEAYYFNEASLNIIIEYFANMRVSKQQTFSNVENYGICGPDMSVGDFCINNFKFIQQEAINAIYKLEYSLDGGLTWKTFNFNTALNNELLSLNFEGYFLIRETTRVGRYIEYEVYFVSAPPEAFASLTRLRDNNPESFSELTRDGETYYLTSFTFSTVSNKYSSYWIVEINDVKYFAGDTLPVLNEAGKTYTIKIYDMLRNIQTFNVVIMGTATPSADFTLVNNKEDLELRITKGQNNSITAVFVYLSVFNIETHEFEFVTKENIFKPTYVFTACGQYKVEIYDNFGRISTYYYEFLKNSPEAEIKNATETIKKEGKSYLTSTKENISITYDNEKYLAFIMKDGVLCPEILYNETSNENFTTITFLENGDYDIILITKEETNNFKSFYLSNAVNAAPPTTGNGETESTGGGSATTGTGDSAGSIGDNSGSLLLPQNKGLGPVNIILIIVAAIAATLGIVILIKVKTNSRKAE